MKKFIKNCFFSVPDEWKEECADSLININIHRSTKIAIMTIIFEIIMFIFGLLRIKYSDGSALSISYVVLYIFYAIFMLVFVFTLKKPSFRVGRHSEFGFALVAFISIMWSIAITMLDQIEYFGISTYVSMVFLYSVAVIIRPLYSFVIYIISFIILAIGLCFYSPNSNMLIGHLITGLFASLFSMYISRLIYATEISNFINKFTIDNQCCKLNTLNAQLEKLAINDELTGIFNRRKFNDCIDLLWNQSIRENKEIGLIMFDIDHFKQYNDHYGHLAGDDCLRIIGKTLLENYRRSNESCFRYGGEEFAIVFFNCSKSKLRQECEKLMTMIDDLKIPHERSVVSPYVTISIGAANFCPSIGDSPDVIINMADISLYYAKNNGRHKFHISEQKK